MTRCRQRFPIGQHRNKTAGFGDRFFHRLNQLRDVDADFYEFMLQRGNRLRIQILFKIQRLTLEGGNLFEEASF